MRFRGSVDGFVLCFFFRSFIYIGRILWFCIVRSSGGRITRFLCFTWISSLSKFGRSVCCIFFGAGRGGGFWGTAVVVLSFSVLGGIFGGL